MVVGGRFCEEWPVFESRVAERTISGLYASVGPVVPAGEAAQVNLRIVFQVLKRVTIA